MADLPKANVEEKPTGELQLSAGFSSIESFIFQASVQQRNFRGRGQTVGLSGSYSKYSKSVEAAFTEPYVFDRNISASFSVYRRDYNSFNYCNDDRNTTYEQATTGFQLRAGVPLTDEPELCAGTGAHDFQPVIRCSECPDGSHWSDRNPASERSLAP